MIWQSERYSTLKFADEFAGQILDTQRKAFMSSFNIEYLYLLRLTFQQYYVLRILIDVAHP
ncbi:hypothetical protein Nos7107_2902 [Nostoc sp. PCC 7107]|nr:hypothetical protein Nos7107_2902 [Nostoc sp. PCC 7107]